MPLSADDWRAMADQEEAAANPCFLRPQQARIGAVGSTGTRTSVIFESLRGGRRVGVVMNTRESARTVDRLRRAEGPEW